MSNKKILWVVLLVVIVVASIVGLVVARPKDNTNNSNNSATVNRNSGEVSEVNGNSNVAEDSNVNSGTEYQKIELSDGTLYSINGEQVKSDIVIGDNYFDTAINDIYLNPDNYYNKNIEIEGMYLASEPYTFVGRYSTSNVCAYCPPGFAYFEYQLDGTIDREFTDKEEWIKVVGTLEKGNDETTNYQDYYYIKVLNLEVMNERGLDTVKN